MIAKPFPRGQAFCFYAKEDRPVKSFHRLTGWQWVGFGVSI
jgi:hypothetical protein